MSSQLCEIVTAERRCHWVAGGQGQGPGHVRAGSTPRLSIRGMLPSCLLFSTSSASSSSSVLQGRKVSAVVFGSLPATLQPFAILPDLVPRTQHTPLLSIQKHASLASLRALAIKQNAFSIHLRHPARHTPHLGHGSSPTRPRHRRPPWRHSSRWGHHWIPWQRAQPARRPLCSSSPLPLNQEPLSSMQGR